MEITGVHHVSLNVRGLSEATEFYASVLGLPILERPDLGVAGAWFGLADGRQIHVIEAPDRKAPRRVRRAIRT